MYSATSLTGYKHTELARQKMSNRFINKEDHPFFGKHHDDRAKLLISKPGSLNPMYGKTHTKETKELIRNGMKKYSNGVGIYDLDNNLIKSFDYAVDLADYLKVSKVTVSKYLNKGLVYNKMYYFKVNSQD
jgi:group I intron endonuclease